MNQASSPAMIRVSFLAIALVAVTACRSPQQNLQKEIDQAVSLNGTLRLTAESWLNNRVPRAFARFAVRSTRDDLESESTKVAKSDLPAAKALLQEIAALRETAATLQRGIDGGNRDAVVRAHASLVRDSEILRRMRDRQEAGTR